MKKLLVEKEKREWKEIRAENRRTSANVSKSGEE